MLQKTAENHVFFKSLCFKDLRAKRQKRQVETARFCMQKHRYLHEISAIFVQDFSKI